MQSTATTCLSTSSNVNFPLSTMNKFLFASSSSASCRASTQSSLRWQKRTYSLPASPWLSLLHQSSRDVGCGEETDSGRLGSQNKKTGRQALCRRQMVAGRRRRSEMHGNMYNIPTSHPIHVTQNITAFLMGQNQQFEVVTQALRNARDMLDPARQAVPSPPNIFMFYRLNCSQIAQS